MVKVNIKTDKLYIKTSCKVGTKVSDILIGNNIKLNLPCNGKYGCGKCKVIAAKGLSEITPYEVKVLGKEQIEKGYRLSCKASIVSDAEITVEKEIYDIDNNADKIDMSLYEQYAVCIDLGTTNTEAVLVGITDSDKKEDVSYKKCKTPLYMYGADVISRAHCSSQGEQQKIMDILKQHIVNIINDYNVPGGKLKEVIIAANTIMLSLFAGQDCSDMIQFPFKCNNLFGYSTDSSEFLLSEENFEIFLMPCISAFVGADALAGAVACGFENKENKRVQLLVDIGTNGEIILKGKDYISAASTAMGPAFEGAHLFMGMQAEKGAVYRVYEKDNKIRYDVIEKTKPVGICAGGVIDLISVLRGLGIIDRTGRLNESSEYVVKINDQQAFKFSDADVYLTQKDIRNIQQAKSALCAGIKTLIDLNGLKESQIDDVILTGSFGKNINIDNAIDIGFIPKEFKGKCIAEENLALKGAKLLSVNDYFKKLSVNLSKCIRSYNLTECEKFDDMYIECMYIDEI